MKKYRFEKWNVAFRYKDEKSFSSDKEFVSIQNPLFYWAADPFVFFIDQKYYIFAELYNRLTFHGEIMFCTIDSNGNVSRWKKALKTKCHLSFPYVYRGGNDIYMMPESSKGESIDIYKAIVFPHKWIKIETIMNGVRYADSIFLDDKHILTYDNDSKCRKYIFLEQKNNSWKIMSVNQDSEVIFRPAGKAFLVESKMYLPLQNSSNGEYGGAVHFVEFNVSDFKFSPDVFSFQPKTTRIKGVDSTKVLGIHTYNFDRDIEVIDYKMRTFNFLSLIGYYFNKIFKKKGQKN